MGVVRSCHVLVPYLEICSISEIYEHVFECLEIWCLDSRDVGETLTGCMSCIFCLPFRGRQYLK